MAIPSLAPASSPDNDLYKGKFDTSAKQRKLEVVPTPVTTPKADRKTFVFLLSAIAVTGLLTLLAINTMLSQGAFELSKLQTQATALNDQREAVMKKIATASSPGQLALRAKAEGMIPSQSPRFLILNSDQSTAKISSSTEAQ